MDSKSSIVEAQNDLGEHGSFVPLLGLLRTVNNKEQRIVVAGDADFASNTRSFNHRSIRYLHGWLADAAFPIYIPQPLPPDKFLTITGKTAEIIKLIYLWIFPGLVLLAATVLLIRRKRK